MAEYTGKDMYLQWAGTGGTVTLNADFRTVSYNPSIDTVETTAGNDTTKSYITGMKDGKVSISLVGQAGGTVLKTALAEGASGTLTIAPEGTATGKEKILIPGLSMGCQMTWPYNNLVEISVEIMQIGNRTDGVY